MPRYDMAKEDVEDLIAYLKVMDSQSDPAISGSTIRVGTVLPTEGRHAGLGDAIRKTIEAVFAEVNANGGINNRKLELVVGGWSDNGNPQIWAARDLVNKEPVAALVSPYVPNYDAELEALATEKRLPVVGPYTVLQPDGDRKGDEDEDNVSPSTCWPGLELQARALVEAATARVTPAETSLAIVYPRVRFFDELAAAAAQPGRGARFRVGHGRGLRTQRVPGRIHRRQPERERAPAPCCSSATPPSCAVRATSRAGTDWQPLLLSPGLLAERNVFELPDSFSRRVLLAYASLPTDYSPEGAADFEQLHEKYGFDYSYSIAQVNAYIAARVLVEGLERAGRDLTREELVNSTRKPRRLPSGARAGVELWRRPAHRFGRAFTSCRWTSSEDRFTEPVRWIVPRDPD